MTAAPWITHPCVEAGRGRVRFGVLNGPVADWPRCVAFVQRAEALSFDSYWVADHPENVPSPWTTLAGLAGVTRTIRLGTLVNCVLYRPATELARLAADVDRMSDGRLILGLGIGDDADEFRRLGIPLPSVKERLTALEETIHVIRGLWGEAPGTYSGQIYQIAGGNIRPGPVQVPRIPLLIAGGGEKVTLRQVAQYADASNLGAHEWAGGAFSAADVQRKFAVLAARCAEFGRPADSVVRSHIAVPLILAKTASQAADKLQALPERFRTLYRSSTVAGTPEDIVSIYQSLVQQGIFYFVTLIFGNDVETLQLLAERVRPALERSIRSF